LHEDASEIWLANHNEVLAVFYVSDQLRSSASAAIRQLKTQGNDVIILSGDKYAAVASACQKLPMDHFLSELSPKDKLDVIAKKQLSGQKVLMVGDGINDSPVLAKADVSVAMASGSELSQNNADVILINGDLTSLSLLKPVANKTIQVTRQNTYWAIIYNLVVLPLAAFGMLSPWIAAIGMSLSSLLVMLNSLRISRTVKMARKEQCYSVSET
jgi:Cu2+-exporting ATPase